MEYHVRTRQHGYMLRRVVRQVTSDSCRGSWAVSGDQL